MQTRNDLSIYSEINHLICTQQSGIYNGQPKLKGQEAAASFAESHIEPQGLNPYVENQPTQIYQLQ